MQKRFPFSCCLIMVCTLLAVIALLPSTASAATLTSSSTGHLMTSMISKTGPLASSHSNPAAVTPATTIHRVSDSDCASRSDFFKLWNGTTSAGGVCFASNGILFVEIDNVYKITSGSNAGHVVDRSGGIFDLCQSQELDHFIAHVTEIDITGRTC